MTANFREWRHFISLRTSDRAHPEIKVIANKIKSILQKNCPNVFMNL
jgi:thymidylate synthase ThyX